MPGGTLTCADKVQHLAVNVFLPTRLQPGTDMGRDSLDVVLQQGYVCKDRMIDALEHVVGAVFLDRRYLKSVVDESTAEGCNGNECAIQDEA